MKGKAFPGGTPCFRAPRLTNQATIATPEGTTALQTQNDNATDQDPILGIGLFSDGFETMSVPVSVPKAREALRQ